MAKLSDLPLSKKVEYCAYCEQMIGRKEDGTLDWCKECHRIPSENDVIKRGICPDCGEILTNASAGLPNHRLGRKLECPVCKKYFR